MKLVTSFSPTTERNDFSGYVGVGFVSPSGSWVTQLGLRKGTSNTGNHNVYLVDGSNNVLASAAIAMTAGSVGTFYYANVTPCFLAAGGTYYIVKQVTSGDGQVWADEASGSLNAQDATAGSMFAVFSSTLGSFSNAGANKMYAGTDLQTPLIYANRKNGTGSATTDAGDNTGATILLAAVITYVNDAKTGVSLSDSTGANTWLPLTNYGNALNRHICIWYVKNPTTSASQTVSLFSPSDVACGIDFASFNLPLDASSPFDAETGLYQITGFTTGAPGAISVSQNLSLVYTAMWASLATTVTIDSNFAKIDYDSVNLGQGHAYAIKLTSGSIGPTWTANTSTDYDMAIASFKPTSTVINTDPPFPVQQPSVHYVPGVMVV